MSEEATLEEIYQALRNAVPQMEEITLSYLINVTIANHKAQLKKAVYSGRFYLLRCTSWTEDTSLAFFALLCMEGHLEAAKRIRREFCSFPVYLWEIFAAVCQYGRLPVAQWMDKEFRVVVYTKRRELYRAVGRAAVAGYIHVAEWLTKKLQALPEVRDKEEMQDELYRTLISYGISQCDIVKLIGERDTVCTVVQLSYDHWVNNHPEIVMEAAIREFRKWQN